MCVVDVSTIQNGKLISYFVDQITNAAFFLRFVTVA